MQTERDAAATAYSICTLVNDPRQYEAMRASFLGRGFSETDCEYLPEFDPPCAFRALNALLRRASGRHVILCHQDVRLIGDDRGTLDARLSDLERLDPAWAVAGNAGGVAPGELALRMTDPHGADRRIGRLPARVMSLDENFLIVRQDARIGFSHDLTGFHLYGADICLMADIAGRTAHVIDFHLQHLSGGRKDQSFHDAETRFREKWSRALRPRWLQTTCTLLRLESGIVGRAVQLAARPYGGVLRRLASAGTWTAATGPGGRAG